MGNTCGKTTKESEMKPNPTSESKASAAVSGPSRPQTSSKISSNVEAENKNVSDPSRPRTSSKLASSDGDVVSKPLSPLAKSLSALQQLGKRILIILAGDASDADGCIELAMLAQQGVDILYLMHISHPFGVPKGKPEKTFEYIHAEAVKSGLPFPGMCSLFNSLADHDEVSYKYSVEKEPQELVDRCQFAFENIFKEFKSKSGTPGKLFFRYRSAENNFFFNRINPFGFVWGSELKTFTEDFNPTGKLDGSSPLPDLDDYSEVIFDISGSTAFWENDAAAKDLVIRARDQGLLKYVVVMGSVVTTEEPKTMAVPGALIRHPMATMNQLYDPLSFRNIAEALSSGPQWVIVTNNIVNEMASYTNIPTQPEFVDFIVNKVLHSKKEECPMLVKVLDSFYKVESKFKWKLFDCLTGKIICDYLQDHNAMVGAGSGPSTSSAMFTESIHGVTVVGPRDTLDNYVAELKLEKEEKSQVTVENVVIPYFTKDWYEKKN